MTAVGCEVACNGDINVVKAELRIGPEDFRISARAAKGFESAE
jgi:hypothetical protein